MSEQSLKSAGTAVIWRALQMAGVKIIFMIRLLVLARLLMPEDFGLLAIAVTAVGFFLNATDIGMIPALIQERVVSDAHYNMAWTVGVIRALTISVIVIISAPLIATIFAEPRAIEIIRVLALRPSIEALSSIKVARLNRELRFRPLALIKLVEAIINTIVAIGLATSLGVWALVAGTLAGSGSYFLMSYLLAPHRPQLVFDRKTIRPLMQFGRWIFLTSLVIMAGSYVLRVIISRNLGTEELGLYFLAFQLAFLPAEIAGEVVGSVAFPLFARLQNDLARVTQAFRTMLNGISILLVPASALIIALAPALVRDVLGPRWIGTVPIIRILTLVGMIGLFGDVAVPVFKGIGKPQRVTVIEIVQSSVLILFAWLLTARFGLIGAALAWLPAMAISMIIALFFLRQLLQQPLSGLAASTAAVAAAAIVGAVVSILIIDLIPSLGGLVIASTASVTVILLLLRAADFHFSLGLANSVVQVFPQIARFVNSQPTGASS